MISTIITIKLIAQYVNESVLNRSLSKKLVLFWRLIVSSLSFSVVVVSSLLLELELSFIVSPSLLELSFTFSTDGSIVIVVDELKLAFSISVSVLSLF